MDDRTLWTDERYLRVEALVPRSARRPGWTRRMTHRERFADQVEVPLAEHEQTFLQISQVRRERRRRRWLATLAVLAVSLIASLGWTVHAANQRAERDRLARQQTLVELGRQQLLTGEPARALPYLTTAYLTGARSPELDFLLTRADDASAPLARDITDHATRNVVAAVGAGGDLLIVGAAAVCFEHLGSATAIRHPAFSTAASARGAAAGATRYAVTYDGALVILDRQCREVARAPLPTPASSSPVFSADETTVAVGVGRKVLVWRWGERPATFVGELPAEVSAIAFLDTDAAIDALGDARLAVGTTHGEIRLFSTTDPSVFTDLRGDEPADRAHGDLIRRIELHPTRPLLLTSSKQHDVRQWYLGGARLAFMGRLGHFSGDVTVTRFSPDGESVIAGGWDTAVHVFRSIPLHINPGGPPAFVFIQAPADGSIHHEAPLRDALFTPDGRFAVTLGEDRRVMVWDLVGPPNGTRLRAFHRVRVIDAGDRDLVAIHLDPDARTLRVIGHDGGVTRWSLQPPDLTAQFQLSTPSDARPNLAVYNGDGSRVAVSTDHGVFIVERGDGAALRLRCELAPSASPPGPFFHPVEFRGLDELVTARRQDGALDGLAQRWRLAAEPGAGVCAVAGPALRHDGRTIHFAKFLDDGGLLTIGEDGRGCLWRPDGSRERCFPETPESRAGYRAALSRDGTLMATTRDDGVVRLWDRATGIERCRWTFAQRPHSVEFGAGHAVLTTAGTGEVVELEPGGTETCRKRAITRHAVAAYHARHAGDGRVLSLSRDGELRLTERETRAQTIYAGMSEVLFSVEVAFSAMDVDLDRALLLTTNPDLTVRAWSLRTGQLLHVYRGHIGGPASIRLRPDRAAAISVGDDRRLIEWRTDSRRWSPSKVTAMRDAAAYVLVRDAAQRRVPLRAFDPH